MPETGGGPSVISKPIQLARGWDSGGRVAALTQFAFEQAAHGKGDKFWHFTRNAVRDMYRYDKRKLASIGVGLAVTAGVVIAGAVSGRRSACFLIFTPVLHYLLQVLRQPGT